MAPEASDWITASATGVGARLAAGEIGARALTEVVLDRIDRLDPTLHAYATLDAEGARAAADRADAELAAGRRRGPLHGVPVAVKDLCDTAGLRTTAGLRALRDRIPHEDAALVARLRAAGAVVLGKLVMTEAALGLHPAGVPPPMNPWNAERWTGISSSGSAVAVAAGLCFAAIGSDTGGSIRVPSACCGLVGLKPTWGRVPLHGVWPLAPSLDHVGPMTRSAADAAALLAVIAGFDARDPGSLRDPVPDYAAALDAGLAGVRIGIDEAFCFEGMDAAVVDQALAAARALERHGAALYAVRIPEIASAVAAWNVLAPAEAAAAYAVRFPAGLDEPGPALAAFLAQGRAAGETELERARGARRAFGAGLSELFEGIDLLASPTLGLHVPLREPLWLQQGIDFDLLLRFTAPFDLSGHPAISVPAGFGADGMPVGLQLVARPLDESLLLRAAHAGQRDTDWHRRSPPLAA